MESETRRPRRWQLALTAVVIGVLGSLLLLEIVLRMLPVCSGMRTQGVSAANPILRFTPNSSFVVSDWNFARVNRGHINNYGFINDQDYHSELATPLFAVVGDSFIEALAVPYAQTLQARLAKLASSHGRVYSFGVSGAPLTQYMAFAEYAARVFKPGALLILVVANDFDESLYKYNRKPGQHVYKEDSQGKLHLTRLDFKPIPIRSLLLSSALLRYVVLNVHPGIASAEQFVGNVPAHVSEERVQDSKRAVDAFLEELPVRTGLPSTKIVFLIDGMRPQLYDELQMQRVAVGSYFDQMRHYFVAQAGAKHYETIDMEPIFEARHRLDKSRFEFPDDAHWNGLAHQLAAGQVSKSHVFETWLRSSSDERAH